ncbi:hypothetical protein C9890_0049 [Perkinsus sp. BL_2016]|nr:hypothetical protein C9890_0049 [Perkinsus sp. BL_2016]
MATAILAAACAPRKLHALFSQGMHAVVFPRKLSANGYMHLLAAARPIRATGTNQNAALVAACRSIGLSSEDDLILADKTNTADCRRILATSCSLTLPMDPPGSAPYRVVRLSGEKLDKQLQGTKELLEGFSGDFLVATSDVGTVWLVDALAFTCDVAEPKTALTETLLAKKATVLIDFAGLSDFHVALEALDSVTRRKLKQNVVRLVVDVPHLPLQAFNRLIAQNRSIWGERVVYRLRFPHTGSLALINSTFTEIVKRASGVKLRLGASSELLVRGPGVVPSRKSDVSCRRFVRTGVCLRLTVGQGESLYRGILGERRGTKTRKSVDRMQPNWNTLRQVPIRLLRKRRGSKGQIYLTDKSQVSAFYRPRYFRSTGRKSRAVFRRYAQKSPNFPSGGAMCHDEKLHLEYEEGVMELQGPAPSDRGKYDFEKFPSAGRFDYKYFETSDCD